MYLYDCELVRCKGMLTNQLKLTKCFALVELLSLFICKVTFMLVCSGKKRGCEIRQGNDECLLASPIGWVICLVVLYLKSD